MPARQTNGAREKILDAADQLFGELGFEAASTRRIAEGSGVNKALIHYHFSNKQALFDAVLDRYYAELGEVLRGSISLEGDIRDRLARVIDVYVDFLGEHRAFCGMVQREVASGRHVEQVRAHMAPLFALGAELVGGAFPASTEGELAGAQLMISFYGMVVTYFSYAPVLPDLLGGDPLAPASLEARKRHLRRMLDLTIDALERDTEA